MKITQSEWCYARAKAVISGASLTRSKAPGKLFDVGAGPMYADSGIGARLRDVDGNYYIDMICALGAIGLGYGATPVRAAEAIQQGWCYSLPSPYEGVAADAILANVAPWASAVRFVKTGSEATHAAYRIAKKATGRENVLVGDWAYHGWHEWATERRIVGTPTDSPTTFQYVHGFDLDHLTEWSWRHIAAIFIEPHRWEPVSVDWLKSVRAFCDRIGALLVFDEMIYGCRWAKGGATEYFGVEPDLACFGKAIGNGAPIACVVGNAVLEEHGQLVSGTYSGDAAALASVVDVLQTYQTQPVIETLWTRGRQLQRGLREALKLYDGEVFLEGEPVHQRIRFGNPSEGRRLAAAMAQRGVLWHPDLINLSYAHTEAQIEQVVEAAMASLAELSRTVMI